MIGLLLALGILMSSAPGTDRSALANPEALARAAAVLNDPARTRPFNILILGDSHSAADHISGALRTSLQARYGAGGRGVLPAALPFAGFTVRQATLTYSGLTSRKGITEGPPAGLSGFTAASRPGARLELASEIESTFDQLIVCFLAEPGAGTLLLTAGTETRTVSARAYSAGPRCEILQTAGPVSLASVEVLDAGVRLYSWSTVRTTGGGVTVSNLGVIGATVDTLLTRDREVLRAELAAYRPDLIIVAFGTNEGFERDLDMVAYADRYARALTLLQDLAPGAALLAAGPPDAATVRPDLYNDDKDEEFDICRPLNADEIANYNAMLARKDPILRRWYAPPALGPVREAQRRIAAARGVAFWDWEARMGGPCSIDGFWREDPRAARGDHVHFTRVGGDRIGGWLARDLQSAFDGTAVVPPGAD